MSLRPSVPCEIRKFLGYDAFGAPQLGAKIREKCDVVTLKVEYEHTTVRADSSGSRGHGEEPRSKNRLLMSPKTKLDLNDQLTVAGVVLRITSKHARFDVTGKLHHWEVEGVPWP